MQYIKFQKKEKFRKPKTEEKKKQMDKNNKKTKKQCFNILQL